MQKRTAKVKLIKKMNSTLYLVMCKIKIVGEKMLKVYFRCGCYSSAKVISWMKEYNIKVEVLNINEISRRDFVKALMTSEKGFEDFLKNRSQVSEELNYKLDILQHLTFNAAVAYTLNNTEMLKTPLILGESKYFVGFNHDELRQFISKDFRNCDLQLKRNAIAGYMND